MPEENIHIQVANFIGNKLQSASVTVPEMESMTTALNWLQAICQGKLVISEAPKAEVPEDDGKSDLSEAA